MLASTKKRRMNKYNIVNPLTDYIAGPNERLVDRSANEINESKQNNKITLSK
jgi:hypothetical protein